MQKTQMALATLSAVIGMAILSTAPVKADMGGMSKNTNLNAARHAKTPSSSAYLKDRP